MKSIQPRKSRKMIYNAPIHKKRKWLASHLSENLLLKYDKRSIPVVKGDTVKVMRGSFKGHEDKVSSVNVKKQTVVVEGITTIKADGTKIAKPMHASNLLITKLNLTDKWRRGGLEKGLSETTKKEIEKEAQEQLKEIKEEEKKKAEELAKLEKEEEQIQEEPSREKSEEKEGKDETKKPEQKPKTEPKKKKEEIKDTTKKKETPKGKISEKKTTKTVKTKQKKEEGKK